MKVVATIPVIEMKPVLTDKWWEMDEDEISSEERHQIREPASQKLNTEPDSKEKVRATVEDDRKYVAKLRYADLTKP